MDGATRLLVCGSLPGERSLAEGRYYAHPGNQFWALMGPAAGVDLVPLAYPDRLAALVAAGIGLWDAVAAAERAGSSDAAICGVEAADLATLCTALPGLRAVAFNGQTAARIGLAAMAGVDAAVRRLTLPSSSALNTSGLAAKRPAWAALADLLR